MTRSFAQIQKQIDALQREAEKARQREVQGVVERIKVAISAYGLTPEDLFGPSRRGRKAQATAEAGPPGLRKMRASAKRAMKKAASAPKYRDPASDKTWTGRGKRPGWFVAAVESGKQPEELAV